MPRHDLKTWPQYYQAIIDGLKTFDIRKDDRGFQVGDELLLREYKPDKQQYTGRQLLVKVTYVTRGGQWGIPEGLVILAIKVEDHVS
jgi:hypothetical protein